MNPDYYKPEPEEFHPGFEYERIMNVVLPDARWGFEVKKFQFTTEIFTSNAMRFNFFEDLKYDKIRVKLLNDEDIQELGWSVNYHSYGRNYVKEDYTLSYTYDRLRIEIVGVEGRVFLGIIKNKSELIRLMKQLNI